MSLISNLFSSLNWSPQQASPTAGALNNPLTAGISRVTNEIASTNVKLSAYSQIQASLVTTQTSATALSGLTALSAPASISAAVKMFAANYDTSINLTQTATKGTGSLVTDLRAQSLNNDLRFATGSNFAALNKIGITVNASSGALTVNAAALNAAIVANPAGVSATLAKLGNQTGQVATNELSTTGNVGGSVAALNKQASTLSMQLSFQQSAASMSTSPLGNQFGGYGIAFYQQMFR